MTTLSENKKSNYCKMTTKQGKIEISTPNGEIIPGVYDVYVKQDTDEAKMGIARITLELIVSINKND